MNSQVPKIEIDIDSDVIHSPIFFELSIECIENLVQSHMKNLGDIQVGN